MGFVCVCVGWRLQGLRVTHDLPCCHAAPQPAAHLPHTMCAVLRLGCRGEDLFGYARHFDAWAAGGSTVPYAIALVRWVFKGA